MTGGCSATNSYAQNAVFSIDLWYITETPTAKSSLLVKRYGHQSQYLNGYLYVFGGFSHRDLPNEIPLTLASCEKHSVMDNRWGHVAAMNESRAFASSIVLADKYIYVFGGMHDFNVLDSVEKYDSVEDLWTQIYVTLP